MPRYLFQNSTVPTSYKQYVPEQQYEERPGVRNWLPTVYLFDIEKVFVFTCF
jgi:hypothetical protein